MVGNMKGLILLYCALISSVLVIISADNCTLPTIQGNAPMFSLAQFIQDINDYNDNFDQNFKELKKFIRANRSLSDEIDVKYLLYTARNPDVNYTLQPTAKSLRESNFNPLFPTAFIIHGYIQKLGVVNSPIGIIKDRLIARYQYNIIFVDYTSQNQGSFPDAVKNGFLVSQNIADFVDFLVKNTPLTTRQLHLIGHSLGAQVAGNAGHLIPGLGRITALDAGGPIYIRLPDRYRLSYHDAIFVDVIHTGDLPFPKGLGFFPPTGHQDFYPNGGQVQPGCVDMPNPSGDPVVDLINGVCDHERSLYLFIASICKDCQFIGVKCDSYENFQQGSCTAKNSVVAEMGIKATPKLLLPPKSKFYLNTTGTFPFCQMSEQALLPIQF